MRLVPASRIMARATLDLDPSVLRQLRHRGQQEHKTMGQVASELLAASLQGIDAQARRVPAGWATGQLGSPNVDLEDKEADASARGSRMTVTPTPPSS